ncbi:hypothetical protein HUV07_19885, partial [Bacteroides uniformis]
MKTLIIAMGILSLFASCSGRKEKLAKKEDSALNEFEVEKSKSYLDTDTLGNIVSFNKGNDTIEICTKRFDIAAFERHKKDHENSTCLLYTSDAADDAHRPC